MFDICSRKNVLVFILAVGFALWQFNKHKHAANESRPAYQMKLASEVIRNRLDPRKYQVAWAKSFPKDEQKIFVLNVPDNSANAPTVLAKVEIDTQLIMASKRERRHRRNGGGRRRPRRQHPGRRGRKRPRHSRKQRQGRGRRMPESIRALPLLQFTAYSEELQHLTGHLLQLGVIARENDGKAPYMVQTQPRNTQKSAQELLDAEEQKQQRRTAARQQEENKKRGEAESKTREQGRKSREASASSAAEELQQVEMSADGELLGAAAGVATTAADGPKSD